MTLTSRVMTKYVRYHNPFIAFKPLPG